MNNIIRQTVADGIRGGRTERRVTQQEFAEMIGTTARTLGKLEHGDCDGIAFSTVVNALDAVGCEIVIRKRTIPDDVALHGIDMRKAFSGMYGGDY